MLKSKYKINNELIFEIIGGQLTVYDSEKSYLHTLDEVATRIVSMIKKGKSVDIIIHNLTKVYDVEKERADRDVKRLLKELLQKNILIKA